MMAGRVFVKGNASMRNIHPTAIISKEAHLPEDITIGPYAIMDGPVTLGPQCVIQAHARIIGPLTMGVRNTVHTGAVLGDFPQDRKYKGEHSETIIGDDNIFREGVTVHRGTGLNTKTVIGSRCYFMANSHAGHNSTVANDVTLVNGAVLGGHTSVGERAIIGAYCQLHQFCRVGRLAMMSNTAAFSVDLPPFFITMNINTLAQLNSVGLRRSGMSHASINALRQMLQIAFREHHGRPIVRALADLPREIAAVPEVQEVVSFCKSAKRGVGRFVPWSLQKNLIRGELPEEG
jgi:UDP-N-acetylglucosamine acyltransferase